MNWGRCPFLSPLHTTCRDSLIEVLGKCHSPLRTVGTCSAQMAVLRVHCS